MREAMGERMERGGSSFGPRGFGGGRRGGPGFQQEELIPKFDADGDGKLNEEERKAAREYVQESMGDRRDFQRPTREASEAKTSLEDDIKESSKNANSTAGLYDEKVLRTLYLRFSNADWYEELADFHRTGVEVPADLIVDGKVYPSVGVHFRGNSSYMMTAEKKPFNIAIDYDDNKQRLHGYKTLNLVNFSCIFLHKYEFTDAKGLRQKDVTKASRFCRDGGNTRIIPLGHGLPPCSLTSLRSTQASDLRPRRG